MSPIKSLKNACLEKVAEMKCNHPNLPLTSLPQKLQDELRQLIISINIRQPPNGEVFQICIFRNTSETNLFQKISDVIHVPLSHIRLLFKIENKCVAIGPWGEHPFWATNEKLIEEVMVAGVEALTANLVYFPSQPGFNYPQWPK